MSPRWLIALLALFVINTLISNVIENEDFLTSSQLETIEESSELQLTEVKDTSIGGVFVSGAATLSAWVAIIGKTLTSDYSFFYNVDYTMTEAQCNALDDGDWNDAAGACQYPNSFMILRYIFYWPLTAAAGLFLLLTLIQVIRGS